MLYLQGKNNIREVNWGATHLWDIRFDDAPPPFNGWFPAVDVEENVFTLETKQLEFYMSTYELPVTTTLFDLKITYLDDVNLTLQKWFTKWINVEILNNGQAITPLDECCKRVHISKFNHQRNNPNSDSNSVQQSSYWVFPKGGMHFNGTSDSEVVSKTVELVIAGTIDVNNYNEEGDRLNFSSRNRRFI